MKNFNILLIDNYDSFTYNFYQLLRQVESNSNITVLPGGEHNAIKKALNAKGKNAVDIVMLSAGPLNPVDSDYCRYALQWSVENRKPMFGLCLGMQIINDFFGGTTKRSTTPMHGRCVPIVHHNTSLFTGIPQKFLAMRYNSLRSYPTISKSGKKETRKKETLMVTAKQSTYANEVMCLEHTTLPICGVQFHPESFLSEHGEKLIHNFFEYYVLHSQR